MPNDTWYVYILRCSDNTLYTGVAKDLDKRMRQHNHGREGAKYTRARRPVELVYQERAENRSIAQQREYRIKQLTAAQKQQLIARARPLLDLPIKNPDDLEHIASRGSDTQPPE